MQKYTTESPASLCRTPENHMTTRDCVCVCVCVALCLYSPHSRKSAGFQQQTSTANPFQSVQAEKVLNKSK